MTVPERVQRHVTTPGVDRYGVEEFIDRFKRKLTIDKLALDDDLAEVGAIFQEVGEEIAYAVSRRDEAKDELARTEADVDNLVRRDAVQTGSKVTDTMAKHAVQLHRDVVGAKARLRNREEELARLQALDRSFTQRGYAIKEMVSLHLAAYFSTTGKTVRHDVESGGRDIRVQEIRRQQATQRNQARDRR
jgi:uncharacterized protein (DUF1778 family)